MKWNWIQINREQLNRVFGVQILKNFADQLQRLLFEFARLAGGGIDKDHHV